MPPSWNGHPVLRYILLSSVYMFPIVAVLSSIPVFSIVIKYNLEENGFSKSISFLWGVIFPWVIALPLLYMPDSLNQFITFSSLLFVSITDFIIPWILYILVMRRITPSSPSPELSKMLTDESDLSMLDALAQESRPGDHRCSDSMSSFPEPGSGQKQNGNGEFEDFVTEKDDPYKGVGEHYTFPPSWGLSPKCRIIVAAVFVVLMILVSVAGTVLSITTSVTTTWNCAAVSA